VTIVDLSLPIRPHVRWKTEVTYVGGSLATKSVRYAFQVWDELRRSG